MFLKKQKRLNSWHIVVKKKKKKKNLKKKKKKKKKKNRMTLSLVDLKLELPNV